MVEQQAPDSPTSFHSGRGCENCSAWKVTMHVRGAAKMIGRVVENR